MKTWRDGTATVLTLVLIFSVATTAQARLVRGPHQPGLQVQGTGNEVVFEGGLAQPLGNQKDEFWTTDNGLEAGTGYELGLRYRYYVGPSWAVSPAFHYVSFGSFSGVGDFPEGNALGFEIRGSLYRYGLDFQKFLGSPDAVAQPYLTGGVALVHNIYRDELEGYGVFSEAVNTPAFSLGAGLKLGMLEVSAAYNFNRFETSKLAGGRAKLDYNWDYAVFKVGFAFGRF